MDKILSDVFGACIRLAHGGKEISVFDIMYETGVAYPELKCALDKLVDRNEVEAIDIKTYRFIGDTDFTPDLPEAPSASEAQEGARDPLEERRALLERRRQEIMASMKRTQEDITDGDLSDLFDADDGEELRHCDDDEEIDKGFSEYEQFLFEEEDGTDEESEEENEELISSVVELFRGGHKNKDLSSVPEHAHWDDEEDFLRFCAERTVNMIAKDKTVGRHGVIKRAEGLIEAFRKENCPELAEVLDRIVYELRCMSDYYFKKIREQCS